MAARTGLLTELNRVAAEWQGVLPTLALQLLQVPRAQWHTVAAVQAMVMNLAAEREAVVGFLHTVIDEVGVLWGLRGLRASALQVLMCICVCNLLFFAWCFTLGSTKTLSRLMPYIAWCITLRRRSSMCTSEQRAFGVTGWHHSTSSCFCVSHSVPPPTGVDSSTGGSA